MKTFFTAFTASTGPCNYVSSSKYLTSALSSCEAILNQEKEKISELPHEQRRKETGLTVSSARLPFVGPGSSMATACGHRLWDWVFHIARASSRLTARETVWEFANTSTHTVTMTNTNTHTQTHARPYTHANARTPSTTIANHQTKPIKQQRNMNNGPMLPRHNKHALSLVCS